MEGKRLQRRATIKRRKMFRKWRARLKAARDDSSMKPERNQFILRPTPSHFSIPPNQNGTMAKPDKWGGKMYCKKYRLLNGGQAWRAAVSIEFTFWPLRRDDHSGALIGAGGTQRSDWPARVLANDVSMRIDGLYACRDKWQLAATLVAFLHLQEGRNLGTYPKPENYPAG